MKTVCLALLLAGSLLASTPARGRGAAVAVAPAQAAASPVLIGAGDIGDCPLKNGKYRPAGTKAEATAKLVESLLPPDPAAGVVFIAGDNAYFQGTRQQYEQCYGPTWGRFKDRTRPVPGNHEYIRDNRPQAAWFARDYFDYFGEARAGRRSEGFYSYDLGGWHVVALNSELRDTASFKPFTKQLKWLKEDLTQNQRRCTLAYWHRPLFTSGEHGFNSPTPGVEPTMRAVWRALDEMGVDVVVNGHDHNYERFNPQDADGNADPNGVVEFVVGTGGTGLRELAIAPANRRNSAAFDRLSYGVLRLTLHPDSYEFEFHTAATDQPGHVFRDKSQAPVPCVD
ncbi:MAG TPA: metallophosphoesterase [Pyrinomonadaceae bacterium]